MKAYSNPVRTGKKLWLPVVVLLGLLCTMLLAACGDRVTTGEASSAQAADSQDLQALDVKTMDLTSRRDRTHPPVTVVATRTASPTQISQEAAATALATWAGQTLGLTPTYSEAKGLTTQVLAEYEIPTQQKGTITANINASRAAYGGKIQNGGYSTLLLGGGSTASNENLSVQIESASLGYLQLPATTYPISSEAALAQIKQAFPGLSGYNFTLAPAPRDNAYAYDFYASSIKTVPGQPPTRVNTKVSAGVVKLGSKIWVFALVGTGTFAPSVQ
jgi:hypothetical protein